MRVVATAGHVDHGKSTLVQALTGTDPDRFPEEKARGLTIDLGFAFTTLPSGQVVGFVDVPGHVRFVKNMLAGVGAVDVALLVVAADEGWMPQTEEHVQILSLLDIDHGLVAITKTDITDEDTIQLTRLDVEERMPGWPVALGVDEVRSTLDAVLRDAPPPIDAARPRLWIDRVFSARGAGTVVTGTLTGGALQRDDEVVVEPGGRRARVRGIESAHVRLDAIGPGNRVALNLTGVDHHDLGRGDAVVLPGQWCVVDTVDVALRGQFPKRAIVDVHLGSGEQLGHLRVLDGDFARIRLSIPAALAPGDRLILRSSGARKTLGGAEVLDVAPARRTRASLPLVERVFAASPWCTPAEFARLSGGASTDGALTVGQWLVLPAELERVRVCAAARTRDSVTEVAAACGVSVAQLRAAGVDLSVEDDPEAVELLATLDKDQFSPPAPSEIGASPALVRALVREGRLVDVDGVIFTADAFAAARQLIAQTVVARGAITVADARDVLHSTRKYVLPLLNRMDADGVTRRQGDQRVPGPRATA
jgi:selenocysteine-specific elongation factor